MGLVNFTWEGKFPRLWGTSVLAWLERAERVQQERTDLLIENLDLRPSDKVVDLGAGSGYFTFRIAPLVPQGKVYAVDISPQMLAIIQAKMKKNAAENVSLF